MVTNEDIYANRIFLNAALPLMKVLADSLPGLKKKFAGKSGVVQVSAVTDDGGLVGTHFNVADGEIAVVLGVSETKPNVELRFKSIPMLNDFFAGRSKKLPKLKGIMSPLFLPTLSTLLTMAKLLGMTAPPGDAPTKDLLVKLYFYLLPAGISQLNKAGEPDVATWAQASPDRVYAWRVEGRDDLASYIRVKAGKTKASRGLYKRAKPFFCMAFDSVDSALGTLLQTDDLMDATINGRLIMEGAPEFGDKIGDFMMKVAALAK